MADVTHTVSYMPKGYVDKDADKVKSYTHTTTKSQTQAPPVKKRKVRIKKERRPPPDDWTTWPIRKRQHDPRIPIFQLPLLCMARRDPRCNGNAPCDNFLNESWHNSGGSYMQNDSILHVTNPSGIMHNGLIVVPSNKPSETLGKSSWEYPDHDQSLAEREQAAILGYLYHMNEMSAVHVRCMHPLKTSKSTHTWNLKMTKFNKYDIYGGNVFSTAYQFWDGKCEPTALFMAAGIPLNKIIPLIKKASGRDWYKEAFHLILDRMISRHPNFIKTQEDALLYIADLSFSPQGTASSFKLKKGVSILDKKTTAANASNNQSNSQSNSSPNAYVNWTYEKKINAARTLMCTDFFPQLGQSVKYLRHKAFTFAQGIHLMLMKMVGFRPYDMKDDYIYQRYDTNGILWSNLNRRCMHR